MSKVIIIKAKNIDMSGGQICFPICFPICFGGSEKLMGIQKNTTKMLSKGINTTKLIGIGVNK